MQARIFICVILSVACSIACSRDAENPSHPGQKTEVDRGAPLDQQQLTELGRELGIEVETGNLPTVEKLVQKGASVNVVVTVVRGDRTPLMLAAEKNHHEIAEFLIVNGAEVDHKVGNGETALLLAAISGDGRTIGLLAEAGAYLDMRSHGEKETPLIRAARVGNVEAIRELMKQGASSGIRAPLVLSTRYQESVEADALLIASHYQQTGSVEALIGSGFRQEPEMRDFTIRYLEERINQDKSSLYAETDRQSVALISRAVLE